jgi:hypothetical protein
MNSSLIPALKTFSAQTFPKPDRPEGYSTISSV